MKYFIFTFILIVANLSVADCDSKLKTGVTGQLWTEAIDAEKNLFLMRFSARAVVNESFSKLKISWKDQEGKPLEVDLNEFNKLILFEAEKIADLYHFGVFMDIPVMKLESADEESLAKKSVPRAQATEVIKFARKLAMQLIEKNEEKLAPYFVVFKDKLWNKYSDVHSEIKNKGWTHEDLYQKKWIYAEITDYASKLERQGKDQATNIGFIGVRDGNEEVDNKMKSIGFMAN